MEGEVSFELVEEGDPITDEDRQNRIANFVGQPQAKAFGGHRTASNKPDAAEAGPEVLVHELSEIARVELDCIADPWQLASGENESGFVPVRPPEALGFETKRGLIGSRSHHVAVDRLEERRDESRVHGVPTYEFARGFEPVDAPVLSS